MRTVLAPHSRTQIDKYLNDVNFDLDGKQIVLTDEQFYKLWNSNVIADFYKRTGQFIDDFETTIITNSKEIEVFKEIVEHWCHDNLVMLKRFHGKGAHLVAMVTLMKSSIFKTYFFLFQV